MVQNVRLLLMLSLYSIKYHLFINKNKIIYILIICSKYLLVRGTHCVCF